MLCLLYGAFVRYWYRRMFQIALIREKIALTTLADYLGITKPHLIKILKGENQNTDIIRQVEKIINTDYALQKTKRIMKTVSTLETARKDTKQLEKELYEFYASQRPLCASQEINSC